MPQPLAAPRCAEPGGGGVGRGCLAAGRAAIWGAGAGAAWSTLSQIVMQIRGSGEIRSRTFVFRDRGAPRGWVTSALGAVAGLYALKLVYAGAIAGIISRSACAPLEMVSTVMMCKGGESGGMRAELKKAWKADGIQGLFKGNGANCLKVAPSRGTQFLVYEYVKRLLVTYGWFGLVPGAPLGALPRLCAGGIAGMVAAVIVYPLEVVKTLRTVFPDECTGIYETIDCVVQKGGGIAGLYRGLVPTLIAMFPYVGVELWSETLKRYWEVRFRRRAISRAYPPPAARPPAATTRPLTLLLLRSATSTGMAAGTATAPPRRDRRRAARSPGAPARHGAPADAIQGVGNIVGDKGGCTKDRQHVPGAVLDRQGRGAGRALCRLGPACLGKVPSTAIGYCLRGQRSRWASSPSGAVRRADIGRGRRAAGPL